VEDFRGYEREPEVESLTALRWQQDQYLLRVKLRIGTAENAILFLSGLKARPTKRSVKRKGCDRRLREPVDCTVLRQVLKPHHFFSGHVAASFEDAFDPLRKPQPSNDPAFNRPSGTCDLRKRFPGTACRASHNRAYGTRETTDRAISRTSIAKPTTRKTRRGYQSGPRT
jgi:hypothetical protein